MTPAPQQIGMRLKATREKRRLSQADVAAKAGISREYLARLEAGKHDPTVGTLERLAKVLGVKLPTLLK
jgi:transcriptional regulator with XRE-family HTH domain